ncbi:hypothetical protein PWT90_01526 [Aphanocladium album]|nr:hypothetical protein PWT90_01526 [Aphanocladium album]
MASSPKPRILFATNSERGQCGVFFATMDALLHSNPDVELHFASFPSLEGETRAISEKATGSNPDIKPIMFHALEGPTHTEAVIKRLTLKYGEDFALPPPTLTRPLDISTTMAAIGDIIGALLGWEGPQFMTVYNSFDAVIKSVVPDLIILDALLSPAITAAWNSGTRFSYLCPNALKDAVASYQPLDILWNYPALMTGYDYPLRWFQRPINIFHHFHTLYRVLYNSDVAATRQYVQEQTGRPMRILLGKANALPDFVRIFVGSLPELDFPLKSHSRVVACGPIIQDVPAVAESDPKLSSWLSNGPTIYVNLGSLFIFTEESATELAKGLNLVLDQLDRRKPNAPRSQVLWKLSSKSGDTTLTASNPRICEAFCGKIEDGRVRIVKWLQTPPLAVLRSGSIVCAVHHGGASSYHETVLVEHLGIGRKGSRSRQPLFEAAELSEALVDVISGEKSELMRSKARELADICKRYGDGPQNAAQGILALATETTAAADKEESIATAEKKVTV